MGQSYLKNAALLTGADVLLRLAGMGLRIYLANALGGEVSTVRSGKSRIR